MRIGILTFSRPRDPAAGTNALVEAATARGHEAVVLFEPLFLVRHLGEKTELLYDNQPLSPFDIIIARPNFVEEPSLHTVTLDALLSAGYALINSHRAFPHTKNKLMQKLILSQARIPTPHWAIVRSPETAEAAADALGYPLILKVAFGTWGKGVFYVENRATLLPLVDYLNIRDKNPVVIEQFIGEAGRRDLRVFVVGGRVVGAMERIAKDGDVRANIHAGARGEIVTLTDAETQIALDAARAFDLEIAGVDVIRSRRGPLVLEVNANPGFESLAEVTGIDIASEIIAYAETRVKQS